MRYFLSGRIPQPDRILLVESGSRGLVEKVAPGLRETWGAGVPIDLVSCYANLPDGLEADHTRVYRVSDYRGRQGRGRLYRELRNNRYALMGIICSGEPLMMKWKWALAIEVPAKVFVINENGDYFWLDRKHLKPLRQLILFRTGLGGAGAVRTLTHIITLPFILMYLILYATIVHVRRSWRRGLSDESHTSTRTRWS